MLSISFNDFEKHSICHRKHLKFKIRIFYLGNYILKLLNIWFKENSKKYDNRKIYRSFRVRSIKVLENIHITKIFNAEKFMFKIFINDVSMKKSSYILLSQNNKII
jgi:hypothetical protein